VTTIPELSALLSGAKAVLFDFDGPLCDVFAGMPADGVARRLEGILGERVDTDDPLQVLRESVRLGQDVVHAVEDALIAAELAAVDCSRPTAGGVEAVHACLAAGKQVGVVSNNSSAAVREFLQGVELVSTVPVVGRSYGDPGRMKPHPWSLETALRLFKVSGSEVVFVGDSITDIQAADAVGILSIAYANKMGKREVFHAMDVVVVDDMREISDATKE
jgi:HAD superfamily hydrolase (TIGR01549 family)